MAPPSSLTIATQAVQRLVKEEGYYHKEQAQQEARIKKLQDAIEAKDPELDSNAEYVLKQEVRGSYLISWFTPPLTSSLLSLYFMFYIFIFSSFDTFYDLNSLGRNASCWFVEDTNRTLFGYSKPH